MLIHDINFFLTYFTLYDSTLDFSAKMSHAEDSVGLHVCWDTYLKSESKSVGHSVVSNPLPPRGL